VLCSDGKIAPADRGRRHNQVAEKTKTVEQARNGLQETESQIAVEVGAKYRKWKEAALLLKATRSGHEAAAEEFRVTTNKHKEQAALVRDLLQAQARSSETAFQYQRKRKANPWVLIRESLNLARKRPLVLPSPGARSELRDA
jgi:hypothetical protein